MCRAAPGERTPTQDIHEGSLKNKILIDPQAQHNNVDSDSDNDDDHDGNNDDNDVDCGCEEEKK